MSRPLLSLCMIVRDEEQLLDRCLESARAYVDEMVVLDTGSVDGTVDRARAAGARVTHREWYDDFAAARNAVLDEARGEYALVLDGDEWIEPGSHPAALRALLQGASNAAWTVDLAERLDGGAIRRFPSVRLFRNWAQHRYAGAFGERIAAFDDESRFRPSGLTVGHDGCLVTQRIGAGRTERSRRMLERLLLADPSDPDARYHAARQYVTIHGGRAVPGSSMEAGLPHLEWIAYNLDRVAEGRAAEIARMHAAALLTAGRVTEAEGVLDSHGDRELGCELLRADVGMSFAVTDADRVAGALERQRACFDLEQAPGPRWEPGLSGPVARARAAEALLLLGRNDEARALAMEATELPDGGAAPWNMLALVEEACERPIEAIRAHMEGLRVDATDPWCWAGLGEMLLARGSVGDAVEPLRNAAGLAPGWGPVEELLATALLLEGQPEDVAQFVQVDLPAPGPSAQAALMLAAACRGDDLPEQAQHPDVPSAIQRILERIAAQGRPDLLERLAHGLRTSMPQG